MMQPFHFWVSAPRRRKQGFMEISVLPSPSQRHSGEPRRGDTLSAHRQRNGYRRCDIPTHIRCRREKEGSPAICNHTDGLGGRYARSDRSDRERHTVYDVTCLWNIKKPNPYTQSPMVVVTRGWGSRGPEDMFKGTDLEPTSR
ncbi:hypothetical protein HJG60_008935 [Phyllostomus discolor]|uniref:Uncharacterized protein n=1 Tax=Phyllostomus discolor TaxID=89673 RepID=A0A833YWT4_9CHIR|nr:hypothetical protein HJG60_008935 [Phyllostomus discolor]